MEYMTTKQAAEKWGISDRRVRTLCTEGKIAGTMKVGKSYRIPADAPKPADGRQKHFEAHKYLKWDNEVVGLIDEQFNVKFLKPNYNEVLSLYTKGKSQWSREQFMAFLTERVVSRDRRDIERILFRCGLSTYDVLKIALITKGIHSKDLMWIADQEDEAFSSAVTDVFESIFIKKKDMEGNSVNSPEGYNIKRYGVCNGKYGIYKQRISPLTTDVESEVAVYLLAKRLGIPCCPACRVDVNSIFSEFIYDFAEEYIVHFRRLFDGARSDNEYENLINVRPQYKEQIIQMLLLDFITRQDDRHLSNIAIKVNKEGESFYPLYDNGRSLFYEDTEDMVKAACENVELYASSFGYSGTYFDYLRDIAAEGCDFSKLISLDITDEEIEEILLESKFSGYRLEGAKIWIRRAIEIIKQL